MNNQKPTITINKMRILLGKEFKDASDEEIKGVLDYLELCADIVVKEIIDNHLSVPNSGLVGCSQPKKLRK